MTAKASERSGDSHCVCLKEMLDHFVTTAAEADMDDSIKRKCIRVSLTNESEERVSAEWSNFAEKASFKMRPGRGKSVNIDLRL